MVEIITSVVEAELGFFQVQIKRMLWHTFELDQSMLGEGPEAFAPGGAIDVRATIDELIVAVVDAQVLGIADID